MHRPRKSAGVLWALAVALTALGLGSPAHAAPALHAERAPAGAAAQEAPVDVNTANEQQLMSVPGIGESLAKRIVQFRDKNGRFEKVDDLMKVQGIGEKSIEKLRPYLTAAKAR